MSIMSILFAAMILISAQRLNKTILESLEFRYQRELAEQTMNYHAPAEANRYSLFGGSFRHGLLVFELSAPAADRRVEDRSILRAQHFEHNRRTKSSSTPLSSWRSNSI